MGGIVLQELGMSVCAVGWGDGGVRRTLVGVDGNLEVGVVVGCRGWGRI